MSGSKGTTTKPLSGKNSREVEERLKTQEVLLRRKIKDFKPWLPKSSFLRKKDVALGTRLKGEIPRRLDRPYSEIDLSDNTSFSHFDKFDHKFDAKRNYFKDRVRSANYKWKTSVTYSSSTSFVTREIIPSCKSKHLTKKETIKKRKMSQKRETNMKSNQKTTKNPLTKPKLLWSRSYEQAKRLKLATQKVL